MLERHHSLGFLENKSQEERVNALKYRPGFELLVTLYEATHGKPLKEIISDEFNSIEGNEAKSLYLTVSLLHRLNSFARAGLIGRVHGISLDRFRSDLHEPLDYIVFDRMDYRIQDHVYYTRHPYIAELVVESVLVDQEDRYNEYCRIVRYLDVDFESDRKAFTSFTNAKKLLSDFSKHEYIDGIYAVALEKNMNNAGLYQQMAIYEAEKGNLGDAEKHIKEADRISFGQDPVIKHTFSELEYKKAEAAKHGLEKKKYYDKAIHLADKLTKSRTQSPHSFHTILKAILGKIELAVEEEDEESVEILIKDFERKLSLTKQTYPYQEFILEIEARFNEFLNNKPLASELLEKAHKLNPANPFITARLVSVLQAEGSLQKVAEILEKTLKHLPGDKDINFLYAQFLIKRNPKDYVQINHYLGKSYTEGDNRHLAQFQHARNLFLAGDITRAKEKFKSLSQLGIDPDIKNRAVEPIAEGGKLVDYKGTIKNSEYNFGFITCDLFTDDIFYYSLQQNADTFSFRDKVKFNIAFNYKGLIAINIHKY